MRTDIVTANLEERLPPTWHTTNTKGSLSTPQLFCTFKINQQFAALLTGSSKNSKGKSTSYQGQFGLKVSQLCLLASPSPHLPPGFDALVDIVRERAAGQESSSPLGHMQVAILQHDLPLAYDNQRGPTELHPLKDVVFSHLQQPQDDGQEGHEHCLPTQGGSVPTPHCWSHQCRQKTSSTALPVQGEL